MVLEDLLTPEGAERKPWHMLPLGALYASIGVFLALWIFREQASLIVVFLTVMACIPLIYKIVKFEEDKETKIDKEMSILKEHRKALSAFIYLFMGFVIASRRTPPKYFCQRPRALSSLRMVVRRLPAILTPL